MSTIKLDTTTWDLALDSAGNLAALDGAEALAQDAASAIKTFSGEVYYDTSIGVPYFSEILSKTPSLALLKQWMVDAALRVPDVAAAQCYLTSLSNREVSGQVQVITSTGEIAAANFSTINPQTGAKK